MQFYDVACFHGTFPYNNIPFFTTGCCVFNTDKKGKAGQHWLAVWKNNGEVTYALLLHIYNTTLSDKTVVFDSFGIQNYSEHLIDSLRSLAGDTSIHMLNVSLQHESTSVCGQWCVLFLILLDKGLNIEYVMKLMYRKNKLSNDKVIYSVFDQFYRATFIL